MSWQICVVLVSLIWAVVVIIGFAAWISTFSKYG